MAAIMNGVEASPPISSELEALFENGAHLLNSAEIAEIPEEQWEALATHTITEPGLRPWSPYALRARVRTNSALVLGMPGDDGTIKMIAYQSRVRLMYQELFNQLAVICDIGVDNLTDGLPETLVGHERSSAWVDPEYRGIGVNTFMKNSLGELNNRNGSLIFELGEAHNIAAVHVNVRKTGLHIVNAQELPYLAAFAQYAPYPPGEGNKPDDLFPLNWATGQEIADLKRSIELYEHLIGLEMDKGDIRRLLGIEDKAREGAEPSSPVLMVSDPEIAEQFNGLLEQAMSRVAEWKAIISENLTKNQIEEYTTRGGIHDNKALLLIAALKQLTREYNRSAAEMPTHLKLLELDMLRDAS